MPTSFGLRAKALLLSKGSTVRWLANETGLEYTGLARMLNGEQRRVSPDSLVLIVMALRKLKPDLSADELLGLSDPGPVLVEQ